MAWDTEENMWSSGGTQNVYSKKGADRSRYLSQNTQVSPQSWDDIRKICEIEKGNCFYRSKNYMVAMVNKSILPIHHNIPFIGNIAYMSQGLKYNIELLLFCK